MNDPRLFSEESLPYIIQCLKEYFPGLSEKNKVGNKCQDFEYKFIGIIGELFYIHGTFIQITFKHGKFFTLLK